MDFESDGQSESTETRHETASPREEDVATMRAAILEKLNYHVGKRRSVATDGDWL